MKRTAGKILANASKGKGSRRQAKWGDWRQYDAAPMIWNTSTPLATSTPLFVEIAGLRLPPASVSTVPFDPNAQLVSGTVTLAEELTFDVQCKGFIDVIFAAQLAHTSDPVFFTHGFYRSVWNQTTVSFNNPDVIIPAGAADINWIARVQETCLMVDSTRATTNCRKRFNFNTTMRIRQGIALTLVFSYISAGLVNYTPQIQYRIRRNVD